MREKATDALLASAIQKIEELEALVSMLENINTDEGPTKLTSKLREIANLFDKLPLLANDLTSIKRGLRRMLSTDPDKTPRAVSVRDFVAVTPEPETTLAQVENPERRIQTRPGLGIPLPKKDR